MRRAELVSLLINVVVARPRLLARTRVVVGHLPPTSRPPADIIKRPALVSLDGLAACALDGNYDSLIATPDRGLLEPRHFDATLAQRLPAVTKVHFTRLKLTIRDQAFHGTLSN